MNASLSDMSSRRYTMNTRLGHPCRGDYQRMGLVLDL